MKSKTLLGLLVSGALTIGVLGAGSAQAKTPGCNSPAKSNPNTPIVAVLGATGRVDPTTSNINQQALNKVIASSEQMGAEMIVSGVDGSASPPNLLADMQMTATGPNTLFKRNDLKCKETAVQRAYASLAKSPANGRIDLLSALRTLSHDLDGRPAKVVHVVVLASAMQTQTIDLDNPKTLGNPAKSINALARKQLNFACRGWRAYAISSNPHKGQAISAQTGAQLQAWWTTYFAHCGGLLVAFNNRLASFPLPPKALAGADMSRIPITVKRTRSTIVATVSGDVLFATGSARLRSGVQPDLNRLLPLVRQARGTITVTGYTDNTGSEAINKPLSRRRAQTVVGWVAQHARLPANRLRVVGKGSRDSMASNATAGGRAKNRRVVLTIYRVVRG